MNKRIKLSDLFPLIKEQLEHGGSTSFTIHGTSMQPLLYDQRDSVRLTKPKSDPKKYDIIFYRRDDGNFLLHRIVGIKEEGYVCRGDNQTVDEYPVKKEWVIGIVDSYTKKGKGKKADSFGFRLYSRFWVNTVLIRKVKRKLFSSIKKILKKGN